MRKSEYDYDSLALIYLQTKSIKEFSEQANLGYSTAKKICKKEEFKSAVVKIRQVTFSKAMNHAQLLADDAITELHRMGMSDKTPAVAKCSALKAVIDASLNSYQLSEIEPLLNQLRKENDY